MAITTRIKQSIYPLYIILRTNGLTNKRLRKLYSVYRKKATQNIKSDYKKLGLRLFSNLDEDGIILWIVASLGIQKGFFIDIGSNDCINSNCANLAFNFNWSGVFIDAEEKQLSIGRRNYQLFNKTKRNKLHFVHSFVTPENINTITQNFAEGEIDFISIDIDGNDYEIFQAISLKPKFFVVESKIEYGKHDIAIGNKNGKGFSPSLFGASAYTMTRLAETQGYTLIATNKQGFNLFYLRNDLISQVLEPISIDDVLNDVSIRESFYDENFMNDLITKLERSSK